LLAATAKVTASDQASGDSRGLVYWYTEVLDTLPALPASVTWENQIFTSSSDYTNLYNDTKDLLNSFSGDDSYSSIYAYVNMTNRESGDATVTVWYPTASSD
jgi:hypothetical protein